MRKIMVCLLSVLLAFALAMPALAQENERVMRVNGSATVSLAADTATIQIGVNTRKDTVREAQSENARLMAAVMQAIKDAGVDEKDIVTSQFNVFSNFDYEIDSFGKEIRKLHYEVQNNVSVTIHDLTMIGTLLDAAMDAGANTSYGITFSSTKQNEAYLKALARAVEDAQQKAQVLAAAAGVELGQLTQITTGQNTVVFGRDAYGISNTYSYDAKAAAGTSITSGDVSVMADVVLEYSFK